MKKRCAPSTRSEWGWDEALRACLLSLLVRVSGLDEALLRGVLGCFWPVGEGGGAGGCVGGEVS